MGAGRKTFAAPHWLCAVPVSGREEGGSTNRRGEGRGLAGGALCEGGLEGRSARGLGVLVVQLPEGRGFGDSDALLPVFWYSLDPGSAESDPQARMTYIHGP